MTYDEKELKNLINKAWQKTVQVIVQSRFDKKCTKSQPLSPTKGMFYMKVDDNSIINKEFKKNFGNQTLSVENPFCIEILLRTRDRVMTLEFWTLYMEDFIDPSVSISSPASATAHNNISLLLKSAMASARLSPAWNLSLHQDSENYVICYRLSAGQPNLGLLGEDIGTQHVGELDVQMFHLTMKLSYRTNLTFAPQRMSPFDQMMLKSDHFNLDSSPKNGRRNRERVSETASCGDYAPPSDESQDGIRNFTPPPGGMIDSPRSRASSESSHRGSQSNVSEKIYIPFAIKQPATNDDYVSDLPSANLLIQASDPDKAEECKQEIKALKERRISESKQPKIKEDRMNTSTQSSRSLPKEDDYVVLDMKTPFAMGEGSCVELNEFFKRAPDLKSFSDEEDPINYAEEIKKFELLQSDFDDLAKSFTEDDQSSESLQFT